ncbi:MAG TPA: hypothetical protein VLS45_02850, partial [Methylomicrobium sp.]|nr:hypothetical protein [Methylomicrobium sp.]
YYSHGNDEYSHESYYHHEHLIARVRTRVYRATMTLSTVMLQLILRAECTDWLTAIEAPEAHGAFLVIDHGEIATLGFPFSWRKV